MSPSGATGKVHVFTNNSNGDIEGWNIGESQVDSCINGVRPVINLRSDVTFSSGNGTQNSPYTVS